LKRLWTYRKRDHRMNGLEHIVENELSHTRLNPHQQFVTSYMGFIAKFPNLSPILGRLSENRIASMTLWHVKRKSARRCNITHLTFMDPCIARCVFYITNEMQLIQCSFIIISALHVSGGFSAHHQEFIILYVQPWVLSCFPAVYR
jgi:hypothetical protein